MRIRRSFLFYGFLFLIGINFFYAFSGAIHYPLAHVDVWSIWMFKAKAIFHSGGVDVDFLQDDSFLYMHPQYPLLLPLLFSGIFFLLGAVDVVAVSLLYPLLYLVILFLAYRLFLKIGYSSGRSVVFVFMYSMLSPLLAQGGRYHAGMADIVLTLLYWIGITLAYSLYRQFNVKHLALIIACVMIASQIKTEGILLIGLLLFVPLRLPSRLIAILLAIGPFIVWWFIRSTYLIPSSYLLVFSSGSVLYARVLQTLTDSFREMFLNVHNWYIFWGLFGMGVLSQRVRNEFISNVICPMTLFMVSAIVLMYGLSTTPIVGFVESSLDRLLLQISPLWMLIFVDIAGELLLKSKINASFRQYFKIHE